MATTLINSKYFQKKRAENLSINVLQQKQNREEVSDAVQQQVADLHGRLEEVSAHVHHDLDGHREARRPEDRPRDEEKGGLPGQTY